MHVQHFFFLLTTALIIASTTVSSQVPSVQWNHGYGTNDFESFESMVQTTDGGFLVGASTSGGINGSKTEPTKGGSDYWIVKIGADGKKKWDKDFGGSGHDYLDDAKQTADGGYILGGSSSSGISGDKTSSATGPWVIKTDPNGIKQWDKSFFSGSGSALYSIQQTTDGGYIFGGSVIGNGDDYWVVKLNGVGVQEWEKKIGGNLDDNLFVLQQTADGGYILGGTSASGITGDKSQPGFGLRDYWIVKLNSNGEQEWDADFGGASSDYLLALKQCSDGGYILQGESYSEINGNKTSPNKGQTDYWAVKTDANGNKEWDVDFGGDDYEYGRGVCETLDGGFLFAGSSKSGISGDQTQSVYGATDYWLVKTDAHGVKEWDSRIGGDSFDDLGEILQTDDGNYIIGGNSSSGKGFDKTQQKFGSADLWIVGLSTECAIPSAPTSTNITSSAAKLSWEEVTGASGYKVNYRELTASLWITVSVLTNELELTGLNASTAYVWKVRSACDMNSGLLSGWCQKQNFTTAPLKAGDGGMMKQNDHGLQVFPNPMTSSSTIEFKIDEATFVRIELQDLQGRKIKTIAAGNFEAGNHHLNFSSKDLSEGTYMIQFNANEKTVFIKLIKQ